MMKKMLSEVCDIQYGYAFDSANFSADQGIPLIRIRDVVRGFSETYTTEVCDQEYIVNDGDILIGMDGEFNIAIWKGGKAYLNQRVCRLLPKGEMDAMYLYYFMPKALKTIEDKTPFVTVKHLSAKELNKIVVPVPPLEKQKKVATCLQRLDELISLRKQQLVKLDELVKSRFIEMFGDLHSTNFPKCKMADICGIKHGYAFNGEFFTEEDNNILLVTPGNFKVGGGFQDKKCKFFTGEYSKEYVLDGGDLIVTMTDLSKNMDTLGYSAIVPQTDRVYLHNQRIGLFVNVSENINRVFLMYFMQTKEYRDNIITSATGSTVHHTSPSKILNCEMFVPPIELQNQFAAFVEQTDKSKFEIQQNLEKLETLKKALMQKYFG